MNYIDVFNGDADGICALHQLRLAKPVKSTLITGVKRDLSLLKKVQAEDEDSIVVLDISLDKNRDDLLRLLEQDCRISYFDHHYPGDIPQHANFISMIDTSPELCTSLLVNQHLKNLYPLWAAVGAYGDNFYKSAKNVVKHLSLTENQHEALCQLGTCLNYNGYGTTLADLMIAPDELYLKVKPYEDPFDFIEEASVFKRLWRGYQEDMDMAENLVAEFEEAHVALYILPDAAWARRVCGVFSNQLARDYPARAHATLTLRQDGDYQVSVRAPLATKDGADRLCRTFSTGGGRKAAAGINRLRKDDVARFIEKFNAEFTR